MAHSTVEDMMNTRFAFTYELFHAKIAGLKRRTDEFLNFQQRKGK